MEFSKSERSTLGIEWELQLIDIDSRDLRQSANAVMDAVEQLNEDTSVIHREMLLNTIELVSKPHHTVAGCIADLAHGVELLRQIVSSQRIELATSGSHPFANPAYQRVTDSHRYAELVNRTQYWGRQMLLFGTHVHVGIENREKVLPILGAMVTRFAHIQALTASSPFWNGVRTGYADNRAMVFQQLPTAGTPYQFTTWQDLERYVSGMLKTGVIDAFDEVRWDIRPSPGFGTLEMRMCDAATNLAEVSLTAALCQCLVEHYSRILDSGEKLPSLPDWFMAENKWRASRYGMDAILILDDAGNEEHVATTLRHLREELTPVAHDLNCEAELSILDDVLRFGAPYQRQLQVADRFDGSREAVVQYMCAEMEAGVPLDPHTFEPDRLGEFGI
ncbi:MAG: glutamate--cysteine ligase [Actinomycetaceae bacterium]|nr:glutamate--cysteine ligase [Arcanobacterium sp.]MDD7504455.1 glutamate--cysteine ligase [Actinomycetaceae bacterium]MDY6143987.1 glutamate--cysteine ligase [Arcanobacterium sp.]